VKVTINPNILLYVCVLWWCRWLLLSAQNVELIQTNASKRKKSSSEKNNIEGMQDV
jgi:hypothetical protein